MSIYQVLSLFSIPTLLVTLIIYVRTQIRAIKKGVQALLRAPLLSEWNYSSDKGHAPIYARDNYENVYQQYHSLGANGVMDDLRKKFLELPDKPTQ